MPSLNLLFRHALEVGKRARTETGIGRGTPPRCRTAAVAMAAERLGGLAGRRVLVLGAGDMGEGMAVALATAGVAERLVANRTWTRPASSAERVGGRAVRLLDARRLRSVERRRAAHLHRRRAIARRARTIVAGP